MLLIFLLLHSIISVPVADADYYRVVILQDERVLIDSWFVPAECDATACQLVPMADDIPYLYNGTYTWFFQSFDREQGYSAWSDAQTLIVQRPPTPVETLRLLSVDDDCLPICRNLTFAFDQQGYDSGDWVELLVMNAMTPVYQEWIHVRQDARCEMQICTISVPLVDDTAYTWYVRTVDSTGGLNGYTRPGGEGDPDGIAYFTVTVPDNPVRDLQVALENGEWRVSWLDESYGYEMVILDAAGQVVHQGWYDSCSQRCQFHIFFPVGTYNWYIRSWNGRWGSWQQGTWLLVADAPAAPVLEDYYGGTFSWQYVLDAAWYELIIMQNEDVYFQAFYRCCDANVDLPLGTFVWSVRAWGAGGSSLNETSQTILIDDSGVVSPQITYPREVVHINGITEALDFRWVAQRGAKAYMLEIFNEQGVIYTARVKPCRNICLHRIPKVELSNGIYSWRIKSVGVEAVSNWSVEHAIIHIAIPVTVSPQLDTPSHDAITPETPTFTWLPVDNAIWYSLIIWDEKGQKVWEGWSMCDPCEISPLSLPSGVYYWQVGSWGPGNNAILSWSSKWIFRIL